jgi:hypothetical protein
MLPLRGLVPRLHQVHVLEPLRALTSRGAITMTSKKPAKKPAP